MWNLRYGTNEPSYRTETDSQTWRTDLWLPRGRDWEFGVSRCKLLHLEWMSNKVLLYSIENYIQSLVMEHDGRYYEKKESIYMYNWVTLQQKLKEHCKSTILINIF